MKKQQDGNILFIIIVAIGLLAALMISLSSSERYSDTIDAEQMNLQLQEIYTYAQTLEKAVSKVMLQNGCEISEVTFDHPSLTNYNTVGYYLNPNSPVDKRCHIFEPEGGGVKYQMPPQMSQDEGSYEYGIVSRHAISGLGTPKSDLILHAHVSLPACLKINKTSEINMIAGTPPQVADFSSDFVPYNTVRSFPTTDISAEDGFSTGTTLGEAPWAAEVYAKKFFCLKENSNDLYHFFYVLLAR